MLDINLLIGEQINCCSKVFESARELFKLLPEIIIFNYSRIYPGGNQIILGSDYDFLSNYISKSNCINKIDLYKQIGLTDNEFIIVSEWVKSLTDKEKVEFISKNEKKERRFNCKEELCLNIHKEKYNEVFHYVCSNTVRDPINFLINSRKILRQFAFKFIHDNKLLIDGEVNKLFGGNPVGELNNMRQTVYQEMPFILPKKFYVNDGKLYLTNAELRCAIEAINGKSNQEIGDSLGISVRTVEVYMDSMRRKIGCDRRNGVIQYFLKNTQNAYLKSDLQ